MINALFNGIIDFVSNLISTIVAPIDSVITQYLPSFADILTNFGNFINQILSVIPWILSWFKIPPVLLVFTCEYLIAKLYLTIIVHSVKLVLSWYRTLKP